MRSVGGIPDFVLGVHSVIGFTRVVDSRPSARASARGDYPRVWSALRGLCHAAQTLEDVIACGWLHHCGSWP